MSSTRQGAPESISPGTLAGPVLEFSGGNRRSRTSLSHKGVERCESLQISVVRGQGRSVGGIRCRHTA